MSFGSESPIVVMKFGGTSVATAEGRDAIAKRVKASVTAGKAPVVVVSAMGRKGAPYATDTLLGLLEDAPGDDRERDLLASVGEVISAVVVAHGLRAAGVAARAFTGPEAGIGTDGEFGESTVAEIHTGPLLATLAGGEVPVVCGFQGISEAGHVTTLGRGGSDTTACALGVALEAEEVEIYTDVNGVMTADPRVCDQATVLDLVGAEELFQMAKHGSRVVHTPAAELALTSGLAVRVRNTYTDHPGTRIADIAAYRPSSVATAVSHASGIARFCVKLGAEEGTPANMAAQTRVFRAMADAGVSLDMFTPVGPTLVFSCAEDRVAPAEGVLETLGLPYELKGGLAKVTLVGSGMHGVPGVMARIAECLSHANVSAWQIADSHTTISVLVEQGDADLAVRALHDGFDLAEQAKNA